ncbi:MAG: YbaN family protein [Faecalitalea cylindroides]
MNIKKILYIVLGTIGLILGAIGAVLPLLPAFPFLLLATVCYAKSSERLHNWFINTKLYKNNLESYVQGNGMSWPVKIRIIIMVTILMSIGFVMMITQKIYYGCFLLSVIWIFHLVYFIFRVKTVPLE